MSELYTNTAYTTSKEWQELFPKPLYDVLELFDGIVQTHTDVLAIAILTALPTLAEGMKVSLSTGGKGLPPVIYGAAFMPSGTGKGAAASCVRNYMLKWKEKLLDQADRENQAKSDDKAAYKPAPDVFLNEASAEGLENSLKTGSAPHFFLDELGILIRMAKNDVVKQALLRSLMMIYDQGTMITRRLKEEKRSREITAKGLGVFAASTIGKGNLSNEDIAEMVGNGALNRFLIVFGGYKPIPYKMELERSEELVVENFSKAFEAHGRDKHFYLSKDAITLYKKYHDQINQSYRQKFFAHDDGAGLTVRQLGFWLRIAGLFQVALDIQEGDKAIDNEIISYSAAVMAGSFLDYMDVNHFDQVAMYMSSKTDKLTAAQRILKRLEKGVATYKSIQVNISKYHSTNEIKEALLKLENSRIIVKEGEEYRLKRG